MKVELVTVSEGESPWDRVNAALNAVFNHDEVPSIIEAPDVRSLLYNRVLVVSESSVTSRQAQEILDKYEEELAEEGDISCDFERSIEDWDPSAEI